MKEVQRWERHEVSKCKRDLDPLPLALDIQQRTISQGSWEGQASDSLIELQMKAA